MLLRMSTLFLRTLREDPADADAASHRLLVRAGYVRRVAPGGYAWLPLGKLVLDRVTEVIRSELVEAGGQELLFPSTGGPLDPGSAELAAALVRDVGPSYRNLPLLLFGVRTGFLEDTRPRAGLLRAREFQVADAYSFDLDPAASRAAYHRVRAAYQRVFDRLGLAYECVAAAPGGSTAEEFLAPVPAGEDTFVRCTQCHYAASTLAVTTPAPPATDPAGHPAATAYDTPDTATIATLVEAANAGRLAGRADWTARDTLKNVVLTARRPGSAEPELLVVGVPGDREVDLRRVAAALHPVSVALFDDFAARPDLVRGYLGPQVLAKLGIRYLVDPRVVPGSAWLTGANEPGRHAAPVVCGRDFVPDSTIEAADVRSGDPCPACHGGRLALHRGIELGHLTELGRRIGDAVGVELAGPRGPVRPVLGGYGMAVSRLVAAIAEQHHDDRGLAWPAAAAPADVHVVAAGRGPQPAAAAELAAGLAGAGHRVLLDDRGVSAGVAFADADLIGIPRTVVVGRRLAEGYVEVRERASGERTEVPLVELVGG
ncbi:His/Gly/Thr/Pro-type tRNA ligase C-terminal domain-containing protein [Plantactinospora sp. KBS50]|uniref:His/Gly/Thr/Pro-type tRNA ligase C-terminal domain-containing protein n=1 Tax=Plantactinospora sp. KBS50 TaxID=2024580 RepID=UPI000BAAF05E|nr:His/Gly/Thr/Pro-type tRNA ligase C-terminal domain-containing protein [Plantactinospora sp. KBS50]ASW52963.1 proline--tRNA ligase [Plantactinospora sp. KBS50]